jgi:hypothetical protein
LVSLKQHPVRLIKLPSPRLHNLIIKPKKHYQNGKEKNPDSAHANNPLFGSRTTNPALSTKRAQESVTWKTGFELGNRRMIKGVTLSRKAMGVECETCSRRKGNEAGILRMETTSE